MDIDLLEDHCSSNLVVVLHIFPLFRDLKYTDIKSWIELTQPSMQPQIPFGNVQNRGKPGNRAPRVLQRSPSGEYARLFGS